MTNLPPFISAVSHDGLMFRDAGPGRAGPPSVVSGQVVGQVSGEAT